MSSSLPSSSAFLPALTTKVSLRWGGFALGWHQLALPVLLPAPFADGRADLMPTGAEGSQPAASDLAGGWLRGPWQRFKAISSSIRNHRWCFCKDYYSCFILNVPWQQQMRCSTALEYLAYSHSAWNLGLRILLLNIFLSSRMKRWPSFLMKCWSPNQVYVKCCTMFHLCAQVHFRGGKLQILTHRDTRVHAWVSAHESTAVGIALAEKQVFTEVHPLIGIKNKVWWNRGIQMLLWSTLEDVKSLYLAMR